MSEGKRFKRVRAVFKNAIVWGVAWGALGTVVSTLRRTSDDIQFVSALLDGIGMGVRIGFVGALAGAAFSTFIILSYRGKLLREISSRRFGIGGAIFAGAFVPVWMQTMNLLSGDGLVPFNLIDSDIVYSTLFGGITAVGTMLIAQRDEARNPDTAGELPARISSESFRVLRSLPADIWVTAHARQWGRYRRFVASASAPNPVDAFIDPDGYRTYIDSAESEFRSGRVH